MNISTEHLTDDSNHRECECGNKTINEYSWEDPESGCVSCPQCMVDWQSSQIKALKKLIYEKSVFNDADTARFINEKYANLMGVSIEDFDDEMDYSKP